MINTPKGLRLHIGIFGRVNVGKSSLINAITNQKVSIVSEKAGTTTDVVEKAMEILPIGPVLFLDTAGLGDLTQLGQEREKVTLKTLERCDVAFLVLEPNKFSFFEKNLVSLFQKKKIPYAFIVNKVDLEKVSFKFLENLKKYNAPIILVSAKRDSQEKILNEIKHVLLKIVPSEFLKEPQLVGDLVKPGGIVVLVVPIDLQAPKGRLILPQVQTIRDALDNDAICIIVKERELPYLLNKLNYEVDLVVCDSQVVLKVNSDVPSHIPLTTFSILMSRLKGDIVEFAKGLAKVRNLKENDKVLIAESCTHHAIEDDIGRVKIPRWLRQYTGLYNLQFDVYAGKNYPENLKEYALVIHCGGCTLNRREMLSRIEKAKEAQVSITNYGMVISLTQGVIERVLKPFPLALNAYLSSKPKKKKRAIDFAEIF